MGEQTALIKRTRLDALNRVGSYLQHYIAYRYRFKHVTISATYVLSSYNVSAEVDIQTTCDVRYKFTCDNGRCLDNSLRCNGRADCLDETDEVGCSTPGKIF